MRPTAEPLPSAFGINRSFVGRWAGVAALACHLTGCGEPVGEHAWIAPAVETVPVPSRGDAADDPAIWIHPDPPERSLVVATDKRSGLLVYDLRGNQLLHLPAGNLNNVDLRTGAWGRDDLTIGVASARQPDELVVFELDHASGELRIVRRNDPVVDEPYGICLFLDEARPPWVVLNGKDGLFVQFELHPDYGATEARRWRTETQPEGCVADDDAGLLYIGEEGYGVGHCPPIPASWPNWPLSRPLSTVALWPMSKGWRCTSRAMLSWTRSGVTLSSPARATTAMRSTTRKRVPAWVRSAWVANRRSTRPRAPMASL